MDDETEITMHWIYLLGLVAVFIGFFALSGIQPDEGRPAAQTRLMSVARIVLALLAVLIIAAYFMGM